MPCSVLAGFGLPVIALGFAISMLAWNLCPLIVLLTRRLTVNWRNPASSLSVDRVAMMSFRCQRCDFKIPTIGDRSVELARRGLLLKYSHHLPCSPESSLQEPSQPSLSSFRDPTSDQLRPTPRHLPFPTPSQSLKPKLLKTALSNVTQFEDREKN
ncbi:hypothetical protein Aduo_008407 [Ancylostoma duodenale]